MKTRSLLLAAVFLSAILTVRAGPIVDQYFPMNNGDNRYYQDSKNNSSTATEYFTQTTYNGHAVFKLNFQDGWPAYPLASHTWYLVNNGGALALYGIKTSWGNLPFNSPANLFTDQTLSNNGTLTSTVTGVYYAAGLGNVTFNISVKTTISSIPGTITVPAGTFANCKLIEVVETATVYGVFQQSFDSAAWVVAPGVGIIEDGVAVWDLYTGQFTGNNGVGGSVDYLKLVSGKINNVPIGSVTTPAITSPTPNSTLTSSSVTFQWSSGTGVTAYDLYVGSSSGAYDIYNQNLGLNRSTTVTGIPTDGRTLYVRLYWEISGVWSHTDYTNTAYTLPSNTTSPTITITSPTSNPTYPTSSSTVSLGGTASDNVGVTQVSWSNDRGGSGTASGTAYWTISNIALQSGANVITVTAYDAAGNKGMDTITVSYNPSCTVTLSSPSSGATVAFPQTFSWTTSGSCANTHLAFATSSTPSTAQVRGQLSGSDTITATDWGSIQSQLGNSTIYYWTVVESVSGVFSKLATWRPFYPVNSGVTLQNGVPVTGIAGAASNQKFYKITVPSGQSTLTISISGGSGDCDLYVKQGSQPTTSSYGYWLNKGGNNETIPVPNPASGDWYVMLRGYSAYSGVTLTATYQTTWTPTVTISATDSSASETGPNTGTFTFTRTGSTAGSLTVNYTIGGTAISGSDYSSIGTSVTIPAGSSSVTRTITPIDDPAVEGTETVVLTLASSSSYTIGSPSSATVNIADNDSGGATPLQNGVPVTGIAGAASNQKFYKITVPSGQSTLTISISGGSGDCDLYVKQGSQPTTSSYGYWLNKGGNNETIPVPNPASGDWYVMLRGYSAYSGVTLKAQYDAVAPMFVGIFGGDLETAEDNPNYLPVTFANGQIEQAVLDKFGSLNSGNMDDLRVIAADNDFGGLFAIGFFVSGKANHGSLISYPGNSDIAKHEVELFFNNHPGAKLFAAGHSVGGGDVQNLLWKLNTLGIKVDLSGHIDSIDGGIINGDEDASIPQNTVRAMGFYQTELLNIHGQNGLYAVNPSISSVSNTPIPDPTGPSSTWLPNGYHRNMDNDERVWGVLLDYIKSRLP